MTTHNVTSLVVEQEGSPVVSGIISLEDIVDWLAEEFRFSAISTQDAFNKLRVNEIFTQDCYTLRRHDSLFKAAELCARTNVKMIPILDDSLRPRGVITQSMLIGELWNNLSLLSQKFRNTPVSELTQSYYVTSLSSSSTALAGFKLMASRRVSGVAITNQEGELVDTLSIKDLKDINKAGGVASLWKNVMQFKKEARQSSGGWKIPKAPLCVLPTETLERVITLMDQSEVHRVWVVDSDVHKRPLNVLTQTDILQFVLPEQNWW
jgi:CBS domain-containing protein